ncbi:Lipase, secreted [Akanthomyces lecanii RCEF 1005]|uniref:Lipase, secreted n=1 Tax=Akanthomyces lecanii RCEF 1005 TaxID=1081108 RepID=A0A168DQ41_CORDF|nr:Lipase, secreted [Akanthomyces lecanii RCEF 1005]
MRLTYLDLAAALLMVLPQAAAHVALVRPRVIMPAVPAEDFFYQPPSGFESQIPGTVLRQRAVVVAFFGKVPNSVQAYQLLYRTSSLNGSAIATVTTIFRPLAAKSDGFVSFQTAYDSATNRCDPSYTYQLGAKQESMYTAAETVLLEDYLLAGYIVASPDYAGPDAAFTAGRVSGMGVLDGIRAVQNFHKTLALTASPMVIGVGYSGGALATGWAAGLQPKYAPELAIKGWVAGGTPANLTGTLVQVDNTSSSGLIPVALAGLAKPSAYQTALQGLYDKIFTDKGREALEFANENCGPVVVKKYGNISVLSTDFQTLGRGLISEAEFAGVLDDSLMGLKKVETPIAPVYLYHSVADEIVPYANASTLSNTWCANGATVKFTTYASGGHEATEQNGSQGALQFVEQAFNGTVVSGCESITVMPSS